jgi:hypothetical protein
MKIANRRSPFHGFGGAHSLDDMVGGNKCCWMLSEDSRMMSVVPLWLNGARKTVWRRGMLSCRVVVVVGWAMLLWTRYVSVWLWLFHPRRARHSREIAGKGVHSWASHIVASHRSWGWGTVRRVVGCQHGHPKLSFLLVVS